MPIVSDAHKIIIIIHYIKRRHIRLNEDKKPYGTTEGVTTGQKHRKMMF